MNAWQNCGVSIVNTVTSWTTRPLSRSTPSADRRVPSAVAFESQTTSSQITGEAQALPGIGVFQTTPRDSLHSMGRSRSAETPSPVGPRNSGHGVAAHPWGVWTYMASPAPASQQHEDHQHKAQQRWMTSRGRRAMSGTFVIGDRMSEKRLAGG